jgi:hypothetical protein
MNVNAEGHLEIGGVPMTEPDNVLHMHYVGAPERFICFASCVLKDGRVVVHSLICDTNRGPEDFLYEVVERPRGGAARRRRWCRTRSITCRNAAIASARAARRRTFLDKLKQELTHGLH